MTTRTLYEKRGRRYHEVEYYDPAHFDGLPLGAHLVVIKPYGRYVRYSVEPDSAGILAAIALHRDTLLKAVRNASCVRPHSAPLSPREKRAYQAYCDVMGHDAMLRLEVPGAHHILDALERALLEANHAD